MKATTDSNGHPRTTQTRRHAKRLSELIAQRKGFLPIWIRAPKGGPEYFTGFSKSKLYDLAGKGLIRSVSMREPGRVSGTRLFELSSILAHIEAAASAGQEGIADN